MVFKSLPILLVLTIFVTQISCSNEKKTESEIKSNEVKSTKVINSEKIIEDRGIPDKKNAHTPFVEIANDLLSKLKNKQYVDVENYFDNIIYSKEKTKDGISLSWEIYKNLAANYKNSEIDIFNAWCNATSHHSAFVVRGIYHIDDAWRARGSNYARYVSDEKFVLFRERLTLALNDLEKAYHLKPDDPNISTHMLTVIRGLGLVDDVRDIWFKRGQDADPTFYWLYDKKLVSLYPKWGGSWEESYSFVRSLYDDPPNESLAYTLMLNLIIESLSDSKIRNKFNGYEDIEKYLNDIEKKYDLEFPEGNLITIKKERIRGSINFMNNKNVDAELSFKKIIEIDPEYHWAWYMLGQMYNKNLNKPQESLGFFNKAIELKDDEGMYYNERGHAAGKARQYELCAQDISRGIELGYSNDNSIMMRAFCYKYMKDYESALQDYTELARTDPNNINTLMAIAELYRELDDFNSSLENYSKALEINPNYTLALQRRATLYYSKIEMLNLAKADVMKILEVEPNNIWAKATLNNYEKEIENKKIELIAD